MRVVYLDELLFVNMLLDYLALSATALIAGKRARKTNIAIASLAGGVYAVASSFHPWLLGLFPAVGMAYIMVAIAFGSKRIYLLFIFLFSASLFCGAVMAAERYFISHAPGDNAKITLRGLLFVVCACYIALRLFMNRQISKAVFEKEIQLQIFCGEKTACLAAVRDTGNRLRDPLTGKGVVVISAAAADSILSPDAAAIVFRVGEYSAADALEMLAERENGFRFGLAPFNTVAERGLLLTFRPDRIEEDGEISNSSLIAFSPNPISFNENPNINAIIN